MAAKEESHDGTAAENDRSIYILTWIGLAFATIAIHLIVADEIAFSDAPSYLYYVDDLYFFKTSDWFIFEPFSKSILLMLRSLTGDTVWTVGIAHYLISATYLLGGLTLFPPSKGNWRGLIMAFALYGSQLAFVTIRATPAYMIASIAVIHAAKGNNRAFLLVGLAILFHISSVLALLPVAALLFKSRLHALSFLQNPRVLFSLLALAGLVFVLAGSTITAVVGAVFSSIPFLGKYLVFSGGLDTTTGGSEFAVGHFVLLGAISVFTAAFLTLQDKGTRSAGIFVIVSFIFYVLTFFAFSPIAAFRQTPFWMLPAFSLFPWQKVGWRGFGHALFLGLAAGMFAFQFSRVV